MAETCGMAVSMRSEGRSEWFLQLSAEDKKRYTAKLSLVEGINPYVLSNNEFSEDKVHLPSLR